VNPSDAGGDGSDTPADAAPPGQLSYMPMGCNYTVTTTPGTIHNMMGDDSTFGMNPTPNNVHVTWASDPSTTAAVLWATDIGTIATVVQYGTSMTSLTQVAHGHVSSGGASGSLLTEHEVHICGLTPGTTYYYQVGGMGHFSAVQQFHTAPAAGSTNDVNFVVAGDSRDSFTIWGNVERQIMTMPGFTQPDFQIFSGDAVLLGTDQGAWNQWMTAAQPMLAQIPFVFVHGNHDALAINYLLQIAQPQFGIAEQDEIYFSLNYGPIHLVVLNDSPASGIPGITGTEQTWLDHDLGAVDRNVTPWVIVAHHKPAFSSSNHAMDGDTLAIRAAWPPIYAAHGVDVVFNGHDHDFEVTHPLNGDGSISTGRGTVYVTAAGAGASLYSSATSTFTQYSESVVNFVGVHANRTTLQLTPYRLDGTRIMQGAVSLTRP
jgi:hypothetical protein